MPWSGFVDLCHVDNDRLWLPSGYLTVCHGKWPIYGWFTYIKWWFSMAMLNNQMVTVWCFSHHRKYESQVGSWSLINGLRRTHDHWSHQAGKVGSIFVGGWYVPPHSGFPALRSAIEWDPAISPTSLPVLFGISENTHKPPTSVHC